MSHLSDLIEKAPALDPSTCWPWAGYLTPTGYGRVRFEGRVTGAHRAVFIATGGDLPDGWEVDHLCRVRDCVNPAHLEAVTHAENVRRTRRASCVNGHAYGLTNTPYINPRGIQECRVCRTDRQRRYEARRAAA